MTGIRRALWRQIRITLGAIIAAVGFSVFQVPLKLAGGGVTGIGIIINHFTNIPVGMIYLALNVPLIILGFFTLAVGALSFPP
jgi:uncharacterized membrane-anchored protein YitT (DUF2179 family)